eukprot:TRINITY_DN1136_c0_g1_i1.p1 TRINITY_DN1136_c0_g1~~TRINITY_DN1136_c0_g1_i1.p1  ORF type:complete len:322 (-),score=136.46 TRINITY_DN1136_c0_g1_i1:86-964(-)
MKVVLFSLAIVGGSAAAPKAATAPHKAAALIEPDLDPKSDKKFFGKDYPYDVSHRTKIDVPYPYPVVQASAAYDSDYTKDENHNKQDATNWELQLKHAKAVSDAAAEVERLQGKLGKEKHDVEKSRPKMPEKFPDEIDLASKDVEGGVKQLEDCKKELEAAKEHLVKLQAEAAEADKAVKDSVDSDKKAGDAEKDAEAKAAQLVSVIDAAQEAHDKADAKLKEEKSRLDDVKQKEKGFEERLRNFRGGSPVPSPPAPKVEEAAPPPERDGAARVNVILSATVAAAAAVLSCA